MIDPAGNPNPAPSGQLGAPPPEAIEVSVIIPCLNEGQSIAFCVDQAVAGLRAAKAQGEVVVDNGSTDGLAHRPLSAPRGLRR